MHGPFIQFFHPDRKVLHLKSQSNNGTSFTGLYEEEVNCLDRRTFNYVCTYSTYIGRGPHLTLQHRYYAWTQDGEEMGGGVSSSLARWSCLCSALDLAWWSRSPQAPYLLDISGGWLACLSVFPFHYLLHLWWMRLQGLRNHASRDLKVGNESGYWDTCDKKVSSRGTSRRGGRKGEGSGGGEQSAMRQYTKMPWWNVCPCMPT